METLDDVSLTSRQCLSQFGDGHCDSECDNEETQFDGFDCISSLTAAAAAGEAVSECNDDMRRAKPASRRSECSLVFADGTCDHDCDSSTCLWDGGDCIGTALRLSRLLPLSWRMISVLFPLDGWFVQLFMSSDIFCMLLEWHLTRLISLKLLLLLLLLSNYQVKSPRRHYLQQYLLIKIGGNR